MRFNDFSALSPPLRPAAPDDDTFVAYADLRAHGVPFTRVHLRRLIGRGLFPAPVQLSPNRQAWRLSDIRAWKASRPTAPVPPVPPSAAA